MKKKIKKEQEKTNSADNNLLDESNQNEPLEVNDTITYKLIIHEKEYEFSNLPSPGADLAGLMICKRVHEQLIFEINEAMKVGILPQFKSSFVNRRKDLVKSVHTIDKTIKHLFKFAFESTSIKE